MSLRRNALLLVLATGLLGILGDWSGDATLARWWRLPAGLLLLGLAYEAWWASRTAVSLRVCTAARWLLGRATTLRFELTQSPRSANGGGRALRVEMVIAAPPEIALERAVRALEVPADERAQLVVTGTARRLGWFEWPSLTARLGGALGLAWWPRRLSCRQRLQVLPDLVREGERAAGLGAAGLRSALRAGAGGEVLQLRDYRPSDPPRVIDWKASARRGRLVSRDFSEDQHLEIVVALDAGAGSGWQAGEVDRLALYANVATRLAQRAVLLDDRVGLLIYAERPLAALAPGHGTLAVARLRAQLAEVRVQQAQGNPLLAAHRIRALLRQRGLVIFLTNLDEPAAFAELAAAARLLLPKHLPFIAGAASEQAERLAVRPVAEPLQAYRALAAQEYRGAMTRNVRALQALGATALLARPQLLDAAVLEAYLQVRARRQVG